MKKTILKDDLKSVRFFPFSIVIISVAATCQVNTNMVNTFDSVNYLLPGEVANQCSTVIAMDCCATPRFLVTRGPRMMGSNPHDVGDNNRVSCAIFRLKAYLQKWEPGIFDTSKLII